MAPDREDDPRPPIKITDKRWKREEAGSTPADEAGVEEPSTGADEARPATSHPNSRRPARRPPSTSITSGGSRRSSTTIASGC